MALQPMRVTRRGIDAQAFTPDDDQLAALIADLRSTLDDLEKGVYNRETRTRGQMTIYELSRVSFELRRDGFPMRASGAEPSGPPSSVVDTWVDDDGVEHTETIPPMSDPVGEAIVANESMPLMRADRRVGRQLVQAADLLHQASSTLLAFEPPPEPAPEPGCSSCNRIGKWVVRYRGKDDDLDTGRCRFCYDWARAHAGEMPPIEILEAHHDGKRITTGLVAKVERDIAIERAREAASHRGKKRKKVRR